MTLNVLGRPHRSGSAVPAVVGVPLRSLAALLLLALLMPEIAEACMIFCAPGCDCGYVCQSGMCCDPTWWNRCQTFGSGCQCSVCKPGFYVTPGNAYCNPKKANGATCTYVQECTSNQCGSGTCGSAATPAPPAPGSLGGGQVCTAPVQCASGSCLCNIPCTGSCCCTTPCTADGGTCASNGNCCGGDCGSNGRCCANANCATCAAGTGDCTSCAANRYLDANQCLADKPNGGTCTTNDMCTSNICTGGYCCQYSNCATCTSGQCTSCAASRYLDNNQCFNDLPNGGSCSANGWCTSGTCTGSVCCQYSNCATCAGGVCTACAANRYLDGSQCYDDKPNGLYCANNDWCTSGICTGNDCCQYSNCLTCTTGQCTSCAANRYLDANQCLADKPNGGTCTTNDWCTSGICTGGYCCQYSNCATCTSGQCTSCAANEYLDTGDANKCKPDRANGLYCANNDWCVTNICTGNVCCQYSNCLTCTDGQCTSCAANEYLDTTDANKCKPDKPNGGSCTTNDWCVSNICTGGVCCEYGNCLTCATGKCTSCAHPLILRTHESTCNTPTATFSATTTGTFSLTVTPPPTPSRSFSRTVSLSPSNSPTRSGLTQSATLTFSGSLSASSSATLTHSVTASPSSSVSPSGLTATISVTSSPSASVSATLTASGTWPTFSRTLSWTITPPPTGTATPSSTVTRTASASPSESSSESSTASDSVSPSESTSRSNTLQPTASASELVSESGTPSPTPSDRSLSAAESASAEATKTVLHEPPYVAVSSPVVRNLRQPHARFGDIVVAAAGMYLGGIDPHHAAQPLRVQLNVSLTPPLRFLPPWIAPSAAPLPPGCWYLSATEASCVRQTSASPLISPIDFVVLVDSDAVRAEDHIDALQPPAGTSNGNNGAAQQRRAMTAAAASTPPMLAVRWSAGLLNFGDTLESGTHDPPAASSRTVLVPSVLDTMRDPATGTMRQPRVDGTTPPLNAAARGSTVALVGVNLDLLPALLPFGPELASVVVNEAATVAWLSLPADPASYHRTPAAANASTMRGSLVAFYTAGGGAATAGEDAFRRLERSVFAAFWLSEDSIGNVASRLPVTAAGETMALSAFGVDLVGGQVMLSTWGGAGTSSGGGGGGGGSSSGTGGGEGGGADSDPPLLTELDAANGTVVIPVPVGGSDPDPNTTVIGVDAGGDVQVVVLPNGTVVMGTPAPTSAPALTAPPGSGTGDGGSGSSGSGSSGSGSSGSGSGSTPSPGSGSGSSGSGSVTPIAGGNASEWSPLPNSTNGSVVVVTLPWPLVGTDSNSDGHDPVLAVDPAQDSGSGGSSGSGSTPSPGSGGSSGSGSTPSPGSGGSSGSGSVLNASAVAATRSHSRSISLSAPVSWLATFPVTSAWGRFVAAAPSADALAALPGTSAASADVNASGEIRIPDDAAAANPALAHTLSTGAATWASGARAVVGSGDPLLRLNVTVTDPTRFTSVTVTARYVLSTYSVAFEQLPDYGLRVQLQWRSGKPVTGTTVVVYTDSALSQPVAAPMRPTVNATGSAECAYLAANVSVVCAPREPLSSAHRFDMVMDAPEVPAYVSSPLAVRVHVRPRNAVWKEMVVRVVRTPGLGFGSAGAGGVLVSASGPAGGPAAPVTQPLPIPPILQSGGGTTAAPGGPNGGASSGRDGGAAGIFAPGMACGAASGLVMYTLIAGAALTVLTTIRATAKRRGSRGADSVDETQVLATAAAALVRRHVYLSAVVPCHVFCAAKHIAVLTVHALAAYAVASAVLNAFPSLSPADSDDPLEVLRSAALVAAITLAALALLKPLADFPFRLFALVDVRTAIHPASKAYAPCDLHLSGGHGAEGMIGVSQSTLAALDADGAVAFDGPHGHKAVSTFRAKDDSGFDTSISSSDHISSDGDVAAMLVDAGDDPFGFEEEAFPTASAVALTEANANQNRSTSRRNSNSTGDDDGDDNATAVAAALGLADEVPIVDFGTELELEADDDDFDVVDDDDDDNMFASPRREPSRGAIALRPSTSVATAPVMAEVAALPVAVEDEDGRALHKQASSDSTSGCDLHTAHSGIATSSPNAVVRLDHAATTTTSSTDDGGDAPSTEAAVATTDAISAAAAQRRNPLTHVTVASRHPSAVGFGVCLLLAAALSFFTVRNTADWCAPEYEAFFAALGVALALDLVVAQPLVGAMALLYEYLSEDAEEQRALEDAELDADEVLEEGRLRRTRWHEEARFRLHPVHGQWQHAGAIVFSDDY